MKRLSTCKLNNRKFGGTLTEQKKQQQKKKEASSAENAESQWPATDGNTSGMTSILIGSAAGIGIGLLASPNNGKKIAGKISQSEVLRSCTRELQRTAQGIITEQAAILMKQGTMNSIHKYQKKMAQRNSEDLLSSSQQDESHQRMSNDQSLKN